MWLPKSFHFSICVSATAVISLFTLSLIVRWETLRHPMVIQQQFKKYSPLPAEKKRTFCMELLSRKRNNTKKQCLTCCALQQTVENENSSRDNRSQFLSDP